MQRTSMIFILSFTLLMSGLPPMLSSVRAQTDGVAEKEAYEIGREAYVYAYPLVLQDASIRQLTNFAEPTGIPGQGPFNRFSHSPAFPPADFKAIVRANVDTLYSIAYLDLGQEPIVLSVPATDRYFVLQMLSLMYCRACESSSKPIYPTMPRVSFASSVGTLLMGVHLDCRPVDPLRQLLC